MLFAILAAKAEELKVSKALLPREVLEEKMASLPPVRDFACALRQGPFFAGKNLRLLAELKKASPSKGLLSPHFHPETLATFFTRLGAAALSVLTEKNYFQGELSFLSRVREVTSLPLLRKDFLWEPYQLLESRLAGADAVLLIVAVLNKKERLASLLNYGESLGLFCLVEIHTEAELAVALEAGARLLVINNRNLFTFETDLTTTFRLRSLIPPGIPVVSASGIKTLEDLDYLASCGVNAVLVGESLVKRWEQANFGES